MSALNSMEQSIKPEATESVESLFRHQISPQRLFPGAQVAVATSEGLQIELAEGFADTQAGVATTTSHLFPIFSGSKPFGAVALWQQIERGKLHLDQPVADHWPEFAAHGKDLVLVRHILCHRGGFPKTPPELLPQDYGNQFLTSKAVAEMSLEHLPGSVSAYHFLTQNWAIAELLRRLDGREYPTYLSEEITLPLGLSSTFIGVPADEESRVVKIHATDGSDEFSLETIRLLHSLPLHSMVVPGASVYSTAGDMALFYAALASGGSGILSRKTTEQMLSLEVTGEIDPTFDVPVRRSLGFELGGVDDLRRQWPGETASLGTFWHGGLGSSVCWADRESGVALAFLANGIRRDAEGAAARRDLSDTVRRVMSPIASLTDLPGSVNGQHQDERKQFD